MKSPVSRYTVYGHSMLPALKDSQDVVSVNWFYKVKAGDIVVIKQDNREIVKRVKKVEGKQVFVQGDNQKESTDSRKFGPVRIDQVIGKVVYS